jgi:hypothetical protein
MRTVVTKARVAAPVRRGGGRLRRALAPVATTLVGLLVAGISPAAPAAATHAGPRPGDESVYLVTLRGAGVAGYRGPMVRSAYRHVLVETQDRALARVGADVPVYRWTTALNGFAVALSPTEADVLRSDPNVVTVERNAVRPLAGGAGPAQGVPGLAAGRGGAGVVVGLVDTGIWPESSLFAPVPGLGRAPRGFHGTCADCNGKLVAARWFVDGFGTDHLRTSSSLSARDDSGHGTQMASIAAGNAGVSVQVPGLRTPSYGGVAPQARIAVYKACWSAPDPADDGCATADLVTAIDRATRDGVDVLNISSGGPSGIDTVERALLGAAEQGVVVVAAAGNGGPTSYSAHSSPWVLTVGGVTGDLRRGRVSLPDGLTLTGAMASSRTAGPARLVLGSRAAAATATPDEARLCLPGSLDASLTSGAIVLCERGGAGRVEKSETVDQAAGVGMVLANVRPGSVESDLHSVPTVHVSRAAGTALRAWHRGHRDARVTLTPLGVRPAEPRVTTWSTSGDPTGAVVKPDLVGPAVGLLGAVPPSVRDTRWDFVSGTSAATAWTSGLALRLLARHDWSADRVRSALVTSSAEVAGDPSVLRAGAGLPDPAVAQRTALAYLAGPGAYRAWLDGYAGTDALNPASVLLSGGDTAARRTVTNVSGRTLTLTARTGGFATHTVRVSPAGLTLRPGASADFRVTATGGDASFDDGWLAWDTGLGSQGRIPVAITR